MVVGRLLSCWDGNFSGAMLNFGRLVDLLVTTVPFSLFWLLISPNTTIHHGETSLVPVHSSHVEKNFPEVFPKWKARRWKKHIITQIITHPKEMGKHNPRVTKHHREQKNRKKHKNRHLKPTNIAKHQPKNTNLFAKNIDFFSAKKKVPGDWSCVGGEEGH